MAENRVVPDMEIEMHAASGRRKWLHPVPLHARRERCDHRETSTSAVSDITERKHAEERIRESEEKYRRIGGNRDGRDRDGRCQCSDYLRQ